MKIPCDRCGKRETETAINVMNQAINLCSHCLDVFERRFRFFMLGG